MSMSTRAAMVLFPPVALLCANASAHHSFSALFQMDTVTEIEGRVTHVNWVNPHVTIQVQNAAGERWEVEAGPLNLLSRMGIERDMIEVGETIRVRGNPGRREARTLWVANILLADNTELLAATRARPHWNSTAVGDASAFFEPGVLAAPAGAELKKWNCGAE